MNFKDWFSSDAWFNSMQEHVTNIALTDSEHAINIVLTDWNESGAYLYILKEYCLYCFEHWSEVAIDYVSRAIDTFKVGLLWNHTVGRIFNSPDNHNTDQHQIVTQDEIKTPPTIGNNIASDESTILNTEVIDLNESGTEMSGQNSTAE